MVKNIQMARSKHHPDKENMTTIKKDRQDMLGIMIKVYTSFSSGRVLIAKLMAEWPFQALWEVVGSSAGFPNDPGWQEHVIIFASFTPFVYWKAT